ncbi:SusC/RagA family TonB-linked outer membrane protein [Sinomicrobium kalidii]|uniref:SusC/RagA family TonB-linked outer membrane protein n=1 Tax=Sinomicrobium kalidii TaxID=2900738 RepID=UPI001E3B7A2C|nr:SusC/RagA family TonB-linked outer membrane protein [Sinomicrobium kalidii]UGU14424.1 SusC/RagA family TonB-linked outer membrane protein [Sinomicrobium kalidii]
MGSKFTQILTLLLAFVVQFSFAQEKTITGNVTDQQGMPLPGVNIVVKGTNTGTQTDFDGNYSITAGEGQVLVFTYLGMATSEQTVGASSTIDLQMTEDTQALEEVVVTGYSVKKQELLASAVSSVSSEEIEQLVPTTNVDNMLQGKSPGVTVTGANGKPGQNAFVRIRGQGSLTAGGSDPLYIVDGSPLREDQLNAISGTDIETITILKDAATTAMYGSRGANGVVLITTKSGKKNQDAAIRFNSRYGFTDEIPLNFDLMDVGSKLDFEKELGDLGVTAAQSLPGYTATPDERTRLIRDGVDWRDAVLRQGVVQSNSLSIAGGEEKVDYFFSINHDRDTGILDHVFGFERLSGRATTNFQANDWLNINIGVSHSRSLADATRDRNNAQNPFRAAYDINSYEPLYQLDSNGDAVLDEDGNPQWNWTHTALNPIEYVKTNLEMVVNNITLANVGATIKFNDNWSYKFNGAVNSQNEVRETQQLPGNRLDQLIGDPAFPGGKTDRNTRRIDYTLTNLLTYRLQTEDHGLDISGLYEFNFNEYNRSFIRSSGYASAELSTVSNAGRIDDAFTERNRLALISYGLFANYDYKEKYIFGGSLRYDGSSNFGQDKQWGLFYSLSGAWNIAKEEFFDVESINDLKLRVSYGTTGNRNIGRYANQNTVLYEAGYPGGQATRPDNIGNPNLQWESSAMTNIGLEFNLFNYRLKGTIDYYKKSTDNLLFRVPTPFESGLDFVNSNVGEIENSGLEISLSGDVIRKENFRWGIGGNISFLDNKIVRLPEAETPGESNDIEPDDAFNINWREGGQINEFYLIRYAGVDPDNGRPLYYGADDNTYYWDEMPEGDNRVMTGKSTIPDFEGGFYTDFKYKGFGLRADFVYRSGNYIYNQVKANLINDGFTPRNNQANDAFNYWKQQGDTNVHPSPLYASEARQTSDRWLQKGDFIRMRNITLSYNLSENVLERTPFKSVRVYLQGQNLLTFTNFFGDPEVGISSGETVSYEDTVAPGEMTLYSYPQRRMYTFGVDISL